MARGGERGGGGKRGLKIGFRFVSHSQDDYFELLMENKDSLAFTFHVIYLSHHVSITSHY